MQFHQVIAQRDTKSHLVQMVSQNRLSHALLFLGKEGSGALSLARAFAQYIVCEKVNGKQVPPEPSLFGDPEPVTEKTVLMDSCGECISCKKAAEMVHPDIHFSYPVIPSKPGDKPVSTDYIKQWRQFMSANPYGSLYDWLQFIGAENKQGNITSAECEDILHKMSLKSFEAGYKILIMWMPEALGKEGNKLLKLIEEPPPGTLFILVAQDESLVLQTLISRSQLIRVPKLSVDEVAEALENREHLPFEKARQVAGISGGNFHEALNLLQHVDDNWEVLLREWLNTIVKTGPAAQVKWIETISKIGREKQKQFLRYFTHLLSHAIRVRTMGIDIAGKTENQSANDFAERLNKLCSLEQQEAIVNELDNATYYVERNANAKILFHALTIRLYHIISNKSVILVN